jgi:hypothetical protein
LTGSGRRHRRPFNKRSSAFDQAFTNFFDKRSECPRFKEADKETVYLAGEAEAASEQMGLGLREKLQLVVEFAGNRVAYLGGDDRRSNNHSDEAKRNQQVMHGGVSWWGSAATALIWMINSIQKN